MDKLYDSKGNELNVGGGSAPPVIIPSESFPVKALIKKVASLNDGEKIEMTEFPYCNKTGNHYAVNAKVTSFGKLYLCQGYNSYRCSYLEITNTSVILHRDTAGTVTTTVSHGLNISGYIAINLQITDDCYAFFHLQTKGGEYKYTFEKWNESANGMARLISEGTSLTNVVYSAANKNFSCPFWIFGASQEGISNSRWLGQLKNLGYFNYLANALAGRNSSSMLTDLKRALNFGRPQYVYFALSNDQASNYKARMKAAAECADEYGFEIIFVTKFVKPNATEDERAEQIEKIDYIKNYGRRVFAFGEAVCDDVYSGVVYPNYMDSDYVHPSTAEGARAIAFRFLVDVPEVMQYGTIKNSSAVGDTESGDGDVLS